MKADAPAVVLAMVAGLISGACSSGAGPSPGGAGGSGASCPNGTACGGNVIGSWTVSSSCLSVTGELNPALAGAGCPSAPVTGSLEVTGTFTVNADGTY